MSSAHTRPQVRGSAHRVGEPQLERKDDAVGELAEGLDALNVLEALEMQREHLGRLFDAQPGPWS